MSAQVALEGTWEEILTHSQELAGQKVRLTIFEQDDLSGTTEEQLLAEYHTLVDMELVGSLTTGQAARLKEIESRLDDRDEKNPNVQALYRRLDEGNNKLDQILEKLDRHSQVQ